MHQLPSGTPSNIAPAALDSKHITAVRKTFDLLDQNAKQYYERLFCGEEGQHSDAALWLLQHTGPYSENDYESLQFAPPQNQIEWKSTTSISVTQQALSVPAAVQVEELSQSESSSAEEIGAPEIDVESEEHLSSEEDYDAPILMQPTSREWISKQFRLTQGDLDRKSRRRTNPNYSQVNEGRNNNK